jgi:hypothetical protein
VILEVTLRRLVGMVVGMKMMGVRHVSVMRGLLVGASFVVPCCFLVVAGSVFEMFGSLRMVLRRFFGHGSSVQWIDS